MTRQPPFPGFRAAVGPKQFLVVPGAGHVAAYNTANGRYERTVPVLLAGGVLGLALGLIGFVAMVVYMIPGHYGMATGQPLNLAPASRPSSLAPTS